MQDIMNKSMVIYKATFPNGKCYIGLTSRTFKERHYQHKRASELDSELPFYRACKKYGFENITWSIIDSAKTVEELSDKEIFWVKFYNSFVGFEDSKGYNATLGGHGFKRTFEVKPSEIYYAKLMYWKNKDLEYAQRMTGLDEYTLKAILQIRPRVYTIDRNLAYKIKNLLAEGKEPEYVAHKYGVSCRSVLDIFYLNRYVDICKHLNETIENLHPYECLSYHESQIMKAKIDMANGYSLSEVAWRNKMRFYAVKDIQRFKTYKDLLPELNIAIQSYKTSYIKKIKSNT